MTPSIRWPTTTLCSLPLGTLRALPAALGRRFSQAYGDALAADFDIRVFGHPVVNWLGDVHWIVDGRHRVYAIQKAGVAGPADSILCEFYEGLSERDMADLCLGRNRSRAVSAVERFLVAVTAGQARECAIMSIVRGADLHIRQDPHPASVHSVGALYRVYDRGGPEVLRGVLVALRDAYDGAPKAFAPVVVNGLGLVFSRYPEIDRSVLVSALAKDHHGAHALLRRAEEYRERLGRQRPHCVAAAVVDSYNRARGRKGRLTKWWKA